ncbi:hypothetical protein M9458_054162, partial [Cirrhinus mrigala]
MRALRSRLSLFSRKEGQPSAPRGPAAAEAQTKLKSWRPQVDLADDAPSLPYKPLQDTSCLNGRVYTAAGQALASLHTMAVLQAYKADLLKDLDRGKGLTPDEVAALRCTTDLALRATKQAATAMGRNMVAMVVTERHLWVNLVEIRRKERGFLLDSPVSPYELFGTSVETVASSAAFKSFIPRRPRSEPEQQKGPGPSRWDWEKVRVKG